MLSRARIRSYLVLLLTLFTPLALSQVYYGPIPKNLEIAPFAGYIVNTNIRTTNGRIITESGPDYGVTVSLDVKKGSQIELLYLYFKGHSSYEPTSDTASGAKFDVQCQYFILGYTQEFRPLKKHTAFFTAGLGAWWARPEYPGLQDTWRVAMEFGGGWKFYFSDAIGIRLQGLALLPLVFQGGGVYAGTGGSGLAVSAGIPIAQFSFSAGLIIVI
jgi:hypothetical protein